MTKRFAQMTLVACLAFGVAMVTSGCDGQPTASKPQADSHAGHDHSAHESHADHAKAPATAAGGKKADAYPLDVCVVSGQKLGSMGEPVVITHEGHTVKLCCQGCVATFKKDPAKYLAKLDAAAGKTGHEGHNH